MGFLFGSGGLFGNGQPSAYTTNANNQITQLQQDQQQVQTQQQANTQAAIQQNQQTYNNAQAQIQQQQQPQQVQQVQQVIAPTQAPPQPQTILPAALAQTFFGGGMTIGDYLGTGTGGLRSTFLGG